mgnify:CR=1 FL=1
MVIDLDAAELGRLLYTRQADLAEGDRRPGLKSVHINRSPVLLPIAMADDAVVLVDAMPEPHYRGAMALYDRPGHIPGAVSIPV